MSFFFSSPSEVANKYKGTAKECTFFFWKFVNTIVNQKKEYSNNFDQGYIQDQSISLFSRNTNSMQYPFFF